MEKRKLLLSIMVVGMFGSAALAIPRWAPQWLGCLKASTIAALDTPSAR